MVDGIALFFDLLYQQELPQHAAFEDDGLLSKKSPADIYGCEHLLRLCLRLPGVVLEAMGEEEARPILAKVNDLVPFLHQHQSTLFVQSYRKLNAAELKEQKKMIKSKERKRKRLCGT
jgi:CxxC motif-containing protein (DUF1111 family)